jgi:molecular chaperone DnaK
MSRDNRTLARFHLDGIPPAPRGIPQIEVTFDIDANGIVHVSAKDLGTGKEQRVTVTASTQLSKDEIDRMVKDAELKAEEDKKTRALIDLKNQTESMAYLTEKAVRDLGERVSDADKSEAEEVVKAAREALATDDEAAIQAALERMTTVSHRLAEEVYKQTAGAPADGSGAGAPPGGEAAPADENVIDADWKPDGEATGSGS